MANTKLANGKDKAALTPTGAVPAVGTKPARAAAATKPVAVKAAPAAVAKTAAGDKPKAVRRPAKAVLKAAPKAQPTPAIVASPAAPAVAVPVAPAPLTPPPAAARKEKPMQTETYTKSIEAVVPAMEKAAADAVAQVQAGAEQMNVKMREMMEKSMKSMTEMTEFAKGNVEAMIESAKAAAAGAETLTTHFVETSKKSVEEAQAAFKTMTSAKTPNELIAAQNEFAKAQFDKAVANMSHFSETWMKLAGEVVQPLSNRVALATETVKKSMAA